ncbi:DUF4249 domain-containing protein [Tellurirhabdus rosea]|uniref:DUF4249 domain-containing protein n=1 Tax=Tellurirhabdus rosea TaxID=2674997 RepID=UPI00225B5D0A|nr:DUF4249 domain-containing protein [Tellurirhabdus rosea]
MKKLSRFLSSCATPALLFLLLAVSCVTPFQPEVATMPRALVVDGQITDQPGPHYVRLTRTADYTNAALNLVEIGATLVITDNLNNRQPLTETADKGTYATPAGFRGVAGRTYTLSIQTADGKRYESAPELLRAPVPIKKLYYEYRQNPLSIAVNDVHGWDVYADLDDPKETDNYYRWSWVHYNQIYACRTVSPPGQDNVFLDYPCCTNCWEIVRCNGCININSDALINGNTLSRQSIVRVPYTSSSRYYLEVEQQHLSKGAFEFLNSAKKLTQSTGGLFDPAPAALRGNVRSLASPEELVFGYFGAAGVTVMPLYVDRRDIRVSPPAQRQVDFGQPSRACVVCENNSFRTPNRPRWWEF